MHLNKKERENMTSVDNGDEIAGLASEGRPVNNQSVESSNPQPSDISPPCASLKRSSSLSLLSDASEENDMLSDEDKKIILERIKNREGSARIKDEFINFEKFSILYEIGPNRGSSESKEPPAKKVKVKGQNKHRPRNIKEQGRDKLCPNIQAERDCPFGDGCRYSHDIAAAMTNKPPDLGPVCYNFETSGHCRAGIKCRFGKSHISKDYKNIIDETRAKNSTETSTNFLKQELRTALRKRKVEFDKANVYLQTLPQGIKNNSQKSSGKNNANGSAIQTKMSTEVDTHLSGNSGAVTDEDVIKTRAAEKKPLDVKGKLLLAPLTTVGNLPFRRICKRFGADITCGEMAMCTNILMGQGSEWALLRRHSSEDVFGVQLCGGFPDTMTKCAELLSNQIDLDFIDVNVGCPIDLVYHKGAGTGLMNRLTKFEQIVRGMSSVMDIPLTVKLRTGVLEGKNMAHTLIPKLYEYGASVVTLHGRSREARYTRSADWTYLAQCAEAAKPYPFIGNGDILSYEDANLHFEKSGCAGLMVARGALIKPWIFTECKEQRHWDISSGERLDILRDFTNYGLEHWGSDSEGVDKTRRFLLEWLSFLHRYVPVALLEHPPQRINERPPYYYGRNDLETLMASPNCNDWIKISELLLGPVPDTFDFLPKHKANAYK